MNTGDDSRVPAPSSRRKRLLKLAIGMTIGGVAGLTVSYLYGVMGST
jgi:hypothetical protein